MFEIKHILFVAFSYAIAHILVVCIYRVTLHPYAKYPGPLLAKFTLLYGAYYSYTGDIHLDLERCHKIYGKFVRYGPNSLAVNSTQGFHDIYDNGKKVRKSQHYIIHGKTNLIGIQDKKEYAKSKKIFQQGFSDTANREHEPKVIKEVNTFVEKLSENESSEKTINGWTNPKNMAYWTTWFTTDVVSKVIFTTSWDLMTSSKNRSITETIKTVVRLVGVLHYWPYLPYHDITALLFLPHLAWSMKALKEFSLAVMTSSQKVREKDPSVKDVYGIFSGARDPDTGELALDHTDVRKNASNFIIAGSDTTASSISSMFFYLSRNPTAYAKVAQEVRSAFSSASDIRAGPALNNCVYLRAAINESLRMAPVVVQPLWRETEAGGCMVDGELIPGGLKVGGGIFTLHHKAEVFPDPYKWDIERWIIDPQKNETEEKERIKEISKSFAPFSVGPRQCIAKNFAMMELLLAMANVFWSLDFEKVGSLGEGRRGIGEGREREGEFQMKGYFTSYMEGPMVRFKKRVV